MPGGRGGREWWDYIDDFLFGPDISLPTPWHGGSGALSGRWGVDDYWWGSDHSYRDREHHGDLSDTAPAPPPRPRPWVPGDPAPSLTGPAPEFGLGLPSFGPTWGGAQAAPVKRGGAGYTLDYPALGSPGGLSGGRTLGGMMRKRG
jgi:hypothetical protein